MEEDAMDRLDAMSTFLDVVEAGSLSAAARRLKMPLTTVSRNVSELELHLRTKLFNRSSRQLVLTERGQLLFDRMQTHSRGRDRSRAHGLR
jgi:DNA-binding transcriptional LysR family regulator